MTDVGSWIVDPGASEGEKVESLRGKVAVVTGAASGIGKAVAIKLAGAGSKVVAVDTNREGVEAVAAGADR